MVKKKVSLKLRTISVAIIAIATFSFIWSLSNTSEYLTYCSTLPAFLKFAGYFFTIMFPAIMSAIIFIFIFIFKDGDLE